MFNTIIYAIYNAEEIQYHFHPSIIFRCNILTYTIFSTTPHMQM